MEAVRIELPEFRASGWLSSAFLALSVGAVAQDPVTRFQSDDFVCPYFVYGMGMYWGPD